MDKTFLISHCAGEFSQHEASLLVQRLVPLALLYRQLNYVRKGLLDRHSPNFEEQKLMLEGSLEFVAEQMTMQLLQFSEQWEDNDTNAE